MAIITPNFTRDQALGTEKRLSMLIGLAALLATSPLRAQQANLRLLIITADLPTGSTASA